MPFEERFALLCERAQKDYDEYLREVAHMDAPGVFKEAMKIVVMEEMLSQIKNGQFDHPYDVELLLYHEHPLQAAYGQWEKSEFGIMTVINETVNELLCRTRENLTDMQARYDTLPPGEQVRVLEYHNRRLDVYNYLQGAEEQAREHDDDMER